MGRYGELLRGERGGAGAGEGSALRLPTRRRPEGSRSHLGRARLGGCVWAASGGVLGLLGGEDVLVEGGLQLLIRKVDEQLLKAVGVERLEAEDVEDAYSQLRVCRDAVHSKGLEAGDVEDAYSQLRV